MLRSPCGVSEAWDPSSNDPEPRLLQFEGIWDTGATLSMVTQRVVDACGLMPIATTAISHAQGMTEDVEVFLVNIGLPNGVGIFGVRVAQAVLPNVDVLLGMDIISQGDFAITSLGGNTKFSFRIPSQANIDFVAEDKRNNVLARQPKPSETTRQKNRRQRRRKG